MEHNTGRPLLFVGSSKEGKRLAEALQANFDGEIQAALWSQGLFGLSETSIESLDRVSREFDFAALIITPDDIVETRGNRRTIARDNVLFEAGLFMGRLGRERTFLVCPREQEVRLPSDLAGMNVAFYSIGSGVSLQATLGPACSRIKETILRLGGIPRAKAASPSSDTSARDGVVPRPRRCNSLGTAIPFGPKQELRIVNISVTGALLQTPRELPVGQVLDLELRLDDGTPIAVTAKVVRVQYPDWGRVGGAGVAFTSVPEASALALERFVEANHPAA